MYFRYTLFRQRHSAVSHRSSGHFHRKYNLPFLPAFLQIYQLFYVINGISEFIQSGNSKVDDLLKVKIEADENIAIEEQTSLAELPENAEIEAYYGDDAWRKLKKDVTFLHGDEAQRRMNLASTNAIRQRAQRLKEDRIRIQRFAFNQDVIRMSDPIGNESIKRLISLLVKEHRLLFY